MRVACQSNRGTSLSSKFLVGDTIHSEFHVNVGKEYDVFGVSVYRGATYLLLLGEDRLPDWYPIDLFSIADPSIPDNWFSAIFAENDPILQFLMGYKTLIFDEGHYDALLEREARALNIFLEEVGVMADRSGAGADS
jgi:hypothetical protein